MVSFPKTYSKLNQCLVMPHTAYVGVLLTAVGSTSRSINDIYLEHVQPIHVPVIVKSSSTID